MTMVTHDRPGPHRRLDVASLFLLLIGLLSGAFCYWLISDAGLNSLFLIPPIVAATIGATHLTKLEAPRDRKAPWR